MICLSFAGDGSIALTSRTSRGARAAERPHTRRHRGHTQVCAVPHQESRLECE
jgi:hypothetical protein